MIVTLAALLSGAVAAGCSSAATQSGSTTGVASGSGTFVPASGTAKNGQIFVRYASKAGGYSFDYPGGWRVKQTGSDVRIARFGNAIVAVVRKRSTKPYFKGYQKQLEAQLKAGKAQALSAITQPARQVKFDRTKATMAVIEQRPSGRPPMVTYRYLFWSHGRILILSCSSPKGIDNGAAFTTIASTVSLP